MNIKIIENNNCSCFCICARYVMNSFFKNTIEEPMRNHKSYIYNFWIKNQLKSWISFSKNCFDSSRIFIYGTIRKTEELKQVYSSSLRNTTNINKNENKSHWYDKLCLKYSIVFCSPSSNETPGDQSSSLLAVDMSGFLLWGSSSTAALWTISLLDFTVKINLSKIV